MRPRRRASGSSRAGKTSLIHSVLPMRDTGGKALEATTSLEYKFTRYGLRRSSRQALAHVWELGGGKSHLKLMDIAINTDTLRNTMVVVVVDMSDPRRAYEDAIFWLAAAQRRAKTVVEKLAKRFAKAPRVMAARAASRLGSGHQDAPKLSRSLLLVPVTIVCCKFDKFKDAPVEKLRVASRAFRTAAHCAGANLVYVDKSDSATRASLRGVIARFLEENPDKQQQTQPKNGAGAPVARGRKRPDAKTQDINAVYVGAGDDTLDDIGTVSGAPVVSAESLREEWADAVRKQFKAQPDAPGGATAASEPEREELRLSDEPTVDSILKQLNAKEAQRQRQAKLKSKMKAADTRTRQPGRSRR